MFQPNDARVGGTGLCLYVYTSVAHTHTLSISLARTRHLKFASSHIDDDKNELTDNNKLSEMLLI